MRSNAVEIIHRGITPKQGPGCRRFAWKQPAHLIKSLEDFQIGFVHACRANVTGSVNDLGRDLLTLSFHRKGREKPTSCGIFEMDGLQ
jgi:hypothetical protein